MHVIRAIARKTDDQERQLRDKQEERELLLMVTSAIKRWNRKQKEKEQQQHFKPTTQNLLQFKEGP